ncbi:MAG: alpha/beta hydrolase [Candidatus Lokiarchaeota archaeon]|nr:alpha/beta hydrolase [Candidatus Lokiarchaeota archaeon]
MVAEKSFKAYEKRRATYVQVPSWMDFKKEQREKYNGVLRIEETWIPGKEAGWKQDLHVTVYAPIDAKTTKAVAACFHGLGNFGEREYYYLAPWLAEHGIVAVVPDLPYFGHNVIHRGAHGRIGKWEAQIAAMTACIKWVLSPDGDLAKREIGVAGLPWFVVGISMSGLGTLDWGLTQFNDSCLDPADMARCKGIASLVPAVKFSLSVSPIKKFLAFIIGKVAPNFVFDQQTAPDPATGKARVSHDPKSVQWCVPCIEKGSMFGLAGEPATKEYQIDCFPGSPLSTVTKVYLAAGRVYKQASKWPRVPLFCTGSSNDDLVDPTGAAEFINSIDPSIPHRYKLYDGWYHPQLGEEKREELFNDILAFVQLT